MSHQDTPKKIGVGVATIIGMNAMIGSGIFSAPSVMAAYVGPAGILAYAFVILSIWFIAQSLARLAQLYPEEGSFYVYARQWGGHTMGLLSSGAYFIGLLIAMGLLTQMSGLYLHHFFPTVSANTLGFIALVALVILNLFGVVLSEAGQMVLIICTVFPLIITTLMCLTKASFANITPFAPHGFANVLKATRIVIFGFFGFECAASLFNIVRQPEKNVPRALTYAILFVGALYMLFISSIILATPAIYFQNATMLVSDILHAIFPQQTWTITVVHIAILSAILGTVHSMIWTSSNLLTLLTKKLQSAPAHHIVQILLPTQKAGVIAVGIAIATSYFTVHNPYIFFSLTALCTVFAYVTAMITLLTQPAEWRSGQNTKTILGIITAGSIVFFALEGLIGAIL